MDGTNRSEYHDKLHLFDNVPVFDAKLVTGSEPLDKRYIELRTDKGRPFSFSEQTRRELESGPGAEMKVPKGLTIDNTNFTRALEIIAAQQIPSHEDLHASGYRDVGSETVNLDVKQIVGPVGLRSWGAFIKGIGHEEPHRPHDLDETLRYAKYLFSSGKYELLQKTADISFNAYEIPDRGRQYYIGTNGQHRTLLLLAFSELGCEVTFRNMRVAVHKKIPR